MNHRASTTLDDIIDELKLTYDPSNGLLDGDAIREVPSVNVLQNLNKLLTKLTKELQEAEETDTKVLALLDNQLASKELKKRLHEQMEAAEEEQDASDGEEEAEEEDEEASEEEVQVVEKKDDEAVVKKPKLEPIEVVEEDEDDVPLVKREPPSEDVPPIQTGHYTQENDTRLKNPKSEFVTSQTVSTGAIAELGLFSEDNNGLETQGKEYLKRKYGVASYPENDLQDLLPGKIPDIDFSKNKPPSNQVQFTTFQSYIESYYRLFASDDIKFLNEKYTMPPGFEKTNYDPEVSPYIIPKLGRFYADVWADEDQGLANKLGITGYQQPSLESYKPRGSVDDLDDDKLYTEDVSCGPLSSRLLSAILSIHEEASGRIDDNSEDAKAELLDDDDNIATKLTKSALNDDLELGTETNDFHSIEERLKRELKYIGIFMNLPAEDEEKKFSINGRSIKTESRGGNIIDNDEWVKNKEDDEVSAEIRKLQKELKEASQRNRQNKKKLIPLVEEQIAYQEYCTILEDLDKQVDQAYIKRLKSRSKKKKTEKQEPNPAQQQAMYASLRSLIDKRNRWIQNIGKLFKPPEIMKRVPSESVLEGGDIEEEIEEDANDVAQEVIDKA